MGRIRIGRPHTRPDAPSHVKGIREGNARRGYRKKVGHHKDGTADARRSTGVGPKKHNAIYKTMPSLPPG